LQKTGKKEEKLTEGILARNSWNEEFRKVVGLLKNREKRPFEGGAVQELRYGSDAGELQSGESRGEPQKVQIMKILEKDHEDSHGKKRQLILRTKRHH